MILYFSSFFGSPVDAFSSSSLSQRVHYQLTTRRYSSRKTLISSRVKTKPSLHVSVDGTNNAPAKKKSKKKRSKNNNNHFSKELGQAKAINKELINASSAQEILDLFIKMGGAKGLAGGGTFNSVNFSTCLHRLARFANQHDNYNQRNQKGNNRNNNDNNKGGKRFTIDEKRRNVLSDPRTAILLASLSEAIVQPKSNEALIFNSRELANLAWAVAKLRVAPPANIYPITRPATSLKNSKSESLEQESGPDTISSSIANINKDILETAAKVRSQVLEVAKERSAMKSAAERAAVKNKWIPTLSQLSGKMLDAIAIQVLSMLDEFNSQELANLLYAFASAGRADHILFEKLSARLVENMEDKSKLFVKDVRKRPKPQEFR